jgi:myosin heavy subunit
LSFKNNNNGGFLVDQFIELVMYYLSEWKNIAIANMNYSVALFIFAFLVGAFLMSLLKRKKVVNLKQQLASQTDSLKQVNSKQEELLKKQKSNEQQLIVQQQQTEQLMTDLQESKSSYDELLKNAQQLKKVLDAKTIEADKFKASLSEKTESVVQLQAALQEQTEKVTQSALDLEKMLATEKEASQAVSELNLVKQQVVQLESELNDKNTQIGESGSSGSNSQARILELEQQLQNLSPDNDLGDREETTALINDGTQSEGIVDKVFSLFKSFDNVGTETVVESNDKPTSSATTEIVEKEEGHADDNSSPEVVKVGVEDANDISESIEYVQSKVKDLFKKIKI